MKTNKLLLLLFLLFAVFFNSYAQTAIFKGKTTWANWVKNLNPDLNPVTTPLDLNERFNKNGNLALDTAYFILDEKNNKAFSLFVNELSLNESVIETNGNSITIVCNKLISKNSSIISFNKSSKTVGGNKYGGQVNIIVLDTLVGKLNVFLDGKSGANGRNGINGEKSNNESRTVAVTETNKNVDTYYDRNSTRYKIMTTTTTNKKEGATVYGNPNKNGTNGEAGENGGNGGNLTVYTPLKNKDSISSQINFSSFGGNNGNGGKGGKASKNGEAGIDGLDGLSGNSGFIKIETYNFDKVFTLNQ